MNGRYIRVFTLNKDTTEVTKLQVDESIELGKETNQVTVLMVAVDEGLDIVLVDKEVY